MIIFYIDIIKYFSVFWSTLGTKNIENSHCHYQIFRVNFEYQYLRVYKYFSVSCPGKSRKNTGPLGPKNLEGPGTWKLEKSRENRNPSGHANWLFFVLKPSNNFIPLPPLFLTFSEIVFEVLKGWVRLTICHPGSFSLRYSSGFPDLGSLN